MPLSVELRRTHGQYRRYEESKNRRSREEATRSGCVGCASRQRPASAAAGLAAGIQAVQEPQIQTAHDRVLLEFAILERPDARSARGGRGLQLRFFGSSYLRV